MRTTAAMVLGALLALSACDKDASSAGTAASASAEAPPPGASIAAASAAPAVASAAASASAAPAPPPDAIIAQHVLVAYKGAKRAPKGVTRSKAEAKARAAEALAKIRAGTPFEDVVKQYSDDTGSIDRMGSLGKFRRDDMDPAFAAAAFSLAVGQVSDPVETPFGFHIINARSEVSPAAGVRVLVRLRLVRRVAGDRWRALRQRPFVRIVRLHERARAGLAGSVH